MSSHSPSVRRLTPRGRGAVATLQLTGDIEILDQLFHPVNHLSIANQELNRICYGWWGDQHSEDLVCTRISPRLMELHCHGGEAAVARILKDLAAIGVQPHNSENSLTLDSRSRQEEFDHCLQQATTQKTAHWILRQATLFPRAMHELSNLDGESRGVRIQKMLAWADFGRHLIIPWKVVLCGLPNVGKSSLINALVGYSRAVVFDQPGTTRDVVSVQTALAGWPIELSDTAGLRSTDQSLEAIGIQKALESINSADLIIVVEDPLRDLPAVELRWSDSNTKTLHVVNKIDLLHPDSIDQGKLNVSAKNLIGIEQLSQAIVQALIPILPEESVAFPVSAQQVRFLISLENEAPPIP